MSRDSRPTGAHGSSITPEVGAQIIREYNTETPRPSAASLATRHGLQARAVQRYLKKHNDAVSQLTEKAVKAELVVASVPQAVAEVRALTKDLPITKMCKIMQEAEAQYEKYRDSKNPDDKPLAGGYLDQMRKCAVEMAKWLGIDKGIVGQDNEIKITVDWGDDDGR